MTYKEHILDCFADGSEDAVQVKSMLELVGIFMEREQIEILINELVDEGMVSIDDSCLGEGGAMYKMTESGSKAWELL